MNRTKCRMDTRTRSETLVNPLGFKCSFDVPVLKNTFQLTGWKVELVIYPPAYINEEFSGLKAQIHK